MGCATGCRSSTCPRDLLAALGLGDTLKGIAGIDATVNTGTRPAVLALTTAEWAVAFTPGPLTAGLEGYYLFLF